MGLASSRKHAVEVRRSEMEIVVLHNPVDGTWGVRAKDSVAGSDQYFVCLWPFQDDEFAARNFADDDLLVNLLWNLELERHLRK